MQQKKGKLGTGLAGACAGAVNGLFGAGGGMVLVPLLETTAQWQEDEIFPASLSVILPVCLVSLAQTAHSGGIPWAASMPYLVGSALGGILAGTLGKRIPTKWLHRILGVLILWGGVRYLC